MIQKSGRRTWRGLGVEALGRLLGRTGRVHSRTDERSREQSRRCTLLLQLLLLLVQLLLRLRLPAALGNGRLKVFVTGQRQHVVTILLPVRQTSPDEILNKNPSFSISSTFQCNRWRRYLGFGTDSRLGRELHFRGLEYSVLLQYGGLRLVVPKRFFTCKQSNRFAF